MAFAVSGLSPVIMTVRMPILRISMNFSAMPGLTTSFRWMTPSTRGPSATTSGVPPPLEMVSTIGARSTGIVPPWAMTHWRTESAAPLRIDRPSTSRPLMRVWAVKGTSSAPGTSSATCP